MTRPSGTDVMVFFVDIVAINASIKKPRRREGSSSSLTTPLTFLTREADEAPCTRLNIRTDGDIFPEACIPILGVS